MKDSDRSRLCSRKPTLLLSVVCGGLEVALVFLASFLVPLLFLFIPLILPALWTAGSPTAWLIALLAKRWQWGPNLFLQLDDRWLIRKEWDKARRRQLM